MSFRGDLFRGTRRGRTRPDRGGAGGDRETTEFRRDGLDRASVDLDVDDVGGEARIDARCETRSDVAANLRVTDQDERRTGRFGDGFERVDLRIEARFLERGIVEAVTGAVRARFNPQTDFVIVEGQLLWHIGVVGIVASRVLQEFYSPTLIIGGENGEMRGSGRSIAGFDLAAALRECGDLLLRHGGHAMAAGLSVMPEKIDLLRERLNAIARRSLQPEDLLPPLRLDAEIGLGELNLDSLAELEKLKPTGQGNPALQFCSRNLAHKRPLQRIGASKQHVKMWVADGSATH